MSTKLSSKHSLKRKSLFNRELHPAERKFESERFSRKSILPGVNRTVVFCHYCGYGPPEVPPDGICPKCGKHTWEENVIRGRLLPQDED